MGSEEKNPIYLGFVENLESPLIEDDFPDKINGKIGGKPYWLNWEEILNSDEVSCKRCKRPMVLLLQIYAPFHIPTAFHRTLYVFCCKNGECYRDMDAKGRFKVFRCQLPKENPYYVMNDNSEWVYNKKGRKMAFSCEVCGLLGNKHCSQCKEAHYCSQLHQKEDWILGHKQECKREDQQKEIQNEKPIQRKYYTLFSEFELVTEENQEVLEETPNNALVENPRDTFARYAKEDIDERYIEMNKDKAFSNFQKTIRAFPDQILRYYGPEGGDPLWISQFGELKKEDVPKCPQCKANRICEFQILPQLISELKLVDPNNPKAPTMDYGILTIYTCKDSCQEKEGQYCEEIVHCQNIV